MVTRFLRAAKHPTKSWKWWVRLASLILVSAAIPRQAVAGSRSSLVFVSVQVVQTCRVDTVGSQTGKGVDLKMLCNSAARPNVGLAGQSTASPAKMATTVTGARSVSTVSLTPTGDGQILRIDF